MKRQERARESDPQNVPRPVDGEVDLVRVDTTWGTVQPIEVAPGVRTVGELELIDLVADGALLVDSRVPDSRSGCTIPGARNLPHDEAVERKDELPDDGLAILFCNGPQCPQSPDAIRQLIEAGVAPDRLAYYRGGLHDWVTLGYPVEPTD